VIVLTALGVKAQLLTVMTDERQVYARAVAEIEARHPGAGELTHHESIPRLLAGRTLVSTMQIPALTTPRRFLFLRSVSAPRQRLGVAILGVLGSASSLAAYGYAAASRRSSRKRWR
jgi:hypothetical protein